MNGVKNKRPGYNAKGTKKEMVEWLKTHPTATVTQLVYQCLAMQMSPSTFNSRMQNLENSPEVRQMRDSLLNHIAETVMLIRKDIRQE